MLALSVILSTASFIAIPLRHLSLISSIDYKRIFEFVVICTSVFRNPTSRGLLGPILFGIKFLIRGPLMPETK
ncbi:hypothetical protein F5X98DRAFT_31733 [Xylaria grammica]|nr:hypothetical protein F5X98DRAFT_31733 [Xylaria grammica]